MLPGSFLLCVLLAIVGQCLGDKVQDEIQILKQIFQNETTYNGEDGCDAVNGSIDGCVDCYPCGHAIILATPSLKQIKEIRNCNGQGWKYSCVGTLINSRAVLTAAHCISGLERPKCILRIRAGEHKFGTDQERFPHVEVDILEVIKHYNFYEPGLHNDIALLILKDPIEQKPHIGFACLADANTEPDLTKKCVVAGWGIKGTGRHPPRRRDTMRSIEMSPLEREGCQNRLRSGLYGHGYNLHESFRCGIGAKGQDILTGDGGAALVCPLPGEQDRYAQYGIVALGRTNGVPSFFTDTTKYRDWIDRNVEENILDTDKDSYVIK